MDCHPFTKALLNEPKSEVRHQQSLKRETFHERFVLLLGANIILHKPHPVIGCKNYYWLKLSKRLLATLALIIVHSIYKGHLMEDSAAPLVLHMHNQSRCVAYIW